MSVRMGRAPGRDQENHCWRLGTTLFWHRPGGRLAVWITALKIVFSAKLGVSDRALAAI